jgi:hypothetical protein
VEVVYVVKTYAVGEGVIEIFGVKCVAGTDLMQKVCTELKVCNRGEGIVYVF